MAQMYRVLTMIFAAAASTGAAQEVANLPSAPEVTYTPISAADAVILYARNFVPSWAGAIAIDLLPAVLVLILAITQSAIRSGRDGTTVEDNLTLAELRAALAAAKEVDAAMEHTEDSRPRDADGNKIKRITGSSS